MRKDMQKLLLILIRSLTARKTIAGVLLLAFGLFVDSRLMGANAPRPASTQPASTRPTEIWDEVSVWMIASPDGPNREVRLATLKRSENASDQEIFAIFNKALERIPPSDRARFLKCLQSKFQKLPPGMSGFTLNTWDEELLKCRLELLRVSLEIEVFGYLNFPPVSPDEARLVRSQIADLTEVITNEAKAAGLSEETVGSGVAALKAAADSSVNPTRYGLVWKPLSEANRSALREKIVNLLHEQAPLARGKQEDEKRLINRTLPEPIVNAFSWPPLSVIKDPNSEYGKLGALMYKTSDKCAKLERSLRTRAASRPQEVKKSSVTETGQVQ
jgi:hypothetical protein